VTYLDGVGDANERTRRGSSFGAVAASYDEHRPGYPVDAVRWCLVPLRRDLAGLRVVDLGAGTGKLTALLTELGADVTAVEPDEAMLAELHRQVPSARAVRAAAEAIPLPDGSADAVLCGQSLHWFDLPRALPEIARVLTAGGVLGALWNSDDDRVPWVAGLEDAAEGAAAPSLTRRREEAARFGHAQFGGAFGEVERAEFGNSQTHTAQSLVATVATHSRFLVMPPPERERLLGQVRAFLAATPEAAGEFELPLVTMALRSVRG
jgi:SAM-dependent methyltransferase